MHPRRASAAAIVLAVSVALAAPGAAVAQGEDDLVALINARRPETRDCAGKQRPASSPLGPSLALARVEATTSADLGKALAASGYLASTAATILVSGPRDPAE